MTTGTPYIGSRISLVSKAEIRYEGVLYDVDSKEATVTLSKVKSFGTENRQAPKQIPPRNEVYEYIIFRGSDIKDLSVSELGNKDESPHLDPAIVSAQTIPPVPSSHSEPNPAFLSRNPGGSSSILPTPPHPVPPGGGYTQFPPPGYNPFGMPYFGRPPLMMGQHLPPRPINSPANQGHQIPHPSTPPTHISSIPSVSQSISSTSQKTAQSSTATVAPPTNSTVVSNMTSATTSQFTPTIAGTTQQLSRNTTSDKPQTSTEQRKTSTDPTTTVTDPTNTSDTATTTSRPIDSNRHSSSPTTTTPGNDGRRQKRGGGGYRDNRDNYQRYPKGPRVVNNWRGGGDRGYTRTPRRGGVSSRPPQSNPQPLKYTEDFDFESANALFSKDQFEKELKSKLQIDDQKEGGANVNDHTPQEEDGRVEEVEGDKEESNADESYDKTKSFFDSLTCDTNKQNNTNRRSNRSQEMALNTETFGTNTRGGRPRRNNGRGYNYRYGGGRGGYYNGYGRGGGYRGRGGYQGGRGGYQGGRGGYQGGRGGNRTYGDRSYVDQDGDRNS